jgi:hypothetical protein
MERYGFALMMLCVSFAVYGQTREDVRVFVPRPTANTGTPEQQAYFQEQFKSEISGAGYAVAENQQNSDYTMQLTIRGNPDFDLYEGEEEFDLLIQLLRNSDGAEVVQFSFPFTKTDDMYEWNLYLVYQALANVPMTKLTAIPKSDYWRNKYLYIAAAGGGDIPWFTVEKYHKKQQDAQGVGNDQATLAPSFLLGLEYHFLNFMSAEADLKFRFMSIEGKKNMLVPSFAAVAKAVIKPSDHFMLEPYAGMEFPMSTDGEIKLPRFAMVGGMQFGVRGGSMGALFIDVNFTYDLGKTKTDTTYGTGEFQRFQIGVLIGYKLGFFNRIKDKSKTG